MKKRFSVELSKLTVALIVLSTVSAVSVCVLLFVQMYSKALLRDARVNSERTVGLAAQSVD